MSLFRIIAAVLLLMTGQAFGQSQSQDEIRLMFDRYIKAENEHNLAAVGQALQDSAEMLWVAPRSTPVWGRDNVMLELTKRYQGAWKLEPQINALKLTVYGETSARLVVPVFYTSGTTASRELYLLQQTDVKTPVGWRIVAMIPAPLPTP